MRVPALSAPTVAPPLSPGGKQAHGRLIGWRRTAARVCWLITALIAVSAFIASFIIGLRKIQAYCPTSACLRAPISAEIAHALQAAHVSFAFVETYVLCLDCAFAASYVLVACGVFWRRSDDPQALFVAFTLLLFGTASFGGLIVALSDTFPILTIPVETLHFWGSELFDLFLLLFPARRFAPRWTILVASVWTARELGASFAPNTPFDSTTWPLILQGVIWAFFLGSVIVAQFYRYRRLSSPAQRRQTRWVVSGIVTALAIYLTSSIVEVIFSPTWSAPHALTIMLICATISYAALPLVPFSIGVAVLRDHLFDVSLIINRTLVYGALTASVMGLYVLIVVGSSALFQMHSNFLISLVATGIVVVLFQPLRGWLQRGVNRLVYGQRDEPYAVLSALGQRLTATLATGAILPTLVETTATALKLPYVAITVFPAVGNSAPSHTDNGQRDSELTAKWGEPVEDILRLPLITATQTIGEITLGQRAPGDPFTTADLRLLDDLARHAGTAAHAVRLSVDLRRLNGDLQRSRVRLLTAREEERRRIRRDLHDGLGSALTGLTLKIAAAQNLLEHDPAAVGALLTDLKMQTQSAIADIRRLVYALRPPALDELGLAQALREHIAQHHLDGAQVILDAPETFPPLPAVVELAAYRITLEALANVTRHAHARICTIHLGVSSATLTLDIQDDGVGLPGDFHAGVGITAMRERAVELGGACRFETTPDGGTRIHVSLPILHEEATTNGGGTP